MSAPQATFQQLQRDLESEILKVPREAPTDAAAGEDEVERIGVVFVHGLGTQPQSATVREFAEPLVAWLREWHRDRACEGFHVLWSRLSYGGGLEGPARFSVFIPGWTDLALARTYRSQQWVMAEAWWAARLEAPQLGTLARWSLGTFPRMIGTLLKAALTLATAQRDPHPHPIPGPLARALAVVNALLFALVYLIALVPGTLLILLLIAAAALPIPAVERFVLIGPLRALLTEQIGDFYVYMYDEVQAVHMRRTVFETISWLVRHAGCTRVVVAGHSHGTVVAFDALTTPDLADEPGTPPLGADIDKVTTILTLGSALNRAWDEAGRMDGWQRARSLPRDLDRPIRWVDSWSDLDPVPAGPLEHGAADPLHVTNELDPVTDHGGYFVNFEEVISRIAQEIDDPVAYSGSRFWPGAGGQRDIVRERQRRVAVLVAFRLTAVAAFALGVVLRYSAGATRDVATLAGLGVGFFLAYLLALGLTFSGWHDRSSRASARSDPPRASAAGIAARGAAFVAIIAVAAVLVVRLPALDALRDLVPLISR